MVRKCAYCKKILGEKEPLKDRRITTGICDSCLERERRRVKLNPVRGLEKLGG